MPEKKFIDFCYDETGKFNIPCSDCKKIDETGQGEFWGSDYLCPVCNQKTIDKWVDSGIKAGVYKRTKAGEIIVICKNDERA